MSSAHSFQVNNRGTSPGVRLVFFSVLSILLMFVDVRFRYLDYARSALSVLVLPIQRLATLPSSLLQEAGEFFVTQNSLLNEKVALQHQHILDAAQRVQLQALLVENQQLRLLLDLQQHNMFTSHAAEIIYAERDVFSRKVIINKGSLSNIQAGQVVMDDKGIIGQVTRVFPWVAEVTLITEKNHAIPVQVLRNGLRIVAFGAGDISHLSLRYMPVNSDIQNGDILVTSGIDGLYPPGIPVARVEKIERDAAYPFARIDCLPIGGVDNYRQLLVLSSLPKLPVVPVVEKPKTRRAGGH
jgi:rod shape-determining protein MreC